MAERDDEANRLSARARRYAKVGVNVGEDAAGAGERVRRETKDVGDLAGHRPTCTTTGARVGAPAR